LFVLLVLYCFHRLPLAKEGEAMKSLETMKVRRVLWLIFVWLVISLFAAWLGVTMMRELSARRPDVLVSLLAALGLILASSGFGFAVGYEKGRWQL
jgi:mannose/fructose/N-acetylgalactosamine-specific phosphotransferase system component IIC